MSTFCWYSHTFTEVCECRTSTCSGIFSVWYRYFHVSTGPWILPPPLMRSSFSRESNYASQHYAPVPFQRLRYVLSLRHESHEAVRYSLYIRHMDVLKRHVRRRRSRKLTTSVKSRAVMSPVCYVRGSTADWSGWWRRGGRGGRGGESRQAAVRPLPGHIQHLTTTRYIYHPLTNDESSSVL